MVVDGAIVAGSDSTELRKPVDVSVLDIVLTFCLLVGSCLTVVVVVVVVVDTVAAIITDTFGVADVFEEEDSEENVRLIAVLDGEGKIRD